MRTLILFFVLAFPSASFANVATVRSGEHNGFTRIVIATPVAANYTYTIGEKRFSLRIDGIASVSLDGAFDRIDRSRVSDISFSNGAIEIETECECPVSVFDMGQNLIVVDFSDAAGVAQAGFEATASRPMVTTDRELFNLLTGRRSFAEESLEPEPSETGSGIERGVLNSAANEVSARVQAELVKQVGHALTQGTLSFDDAHRRVISDGMTGGDEPIGLAALETLANEDLGVRFEASELQAAQPNSEADPGNVEIGLGELVQAPDCGADGNFSILEWAPAKPFDVAISSLRRELVAEFDALNEDVLLQLARTYSYFGFGAEAISIVELSDTASVALEAVRQVALVLEYGQAEGLAQMGLLECNGPVALWTALSMPSISDHVIFDEDSAIRELNILPKHLRKILAPKLSMLLRERGSAKKAALVMRGAERSESKLSSRGRLEVSELELDENRDTSDAVLSTVMAESSQEAPRALISYINRRTGTGEEISSEMALLAESFALQYRGTDIELELVAAQMISLAKSGQFEGAFDLLLKAHGEGRDLGKSVSDLFFVLSDVANDVTFLKYAPIPVSTLDLEVSEAARIRIVERALSLGFNEVADDVLNSLVQEAGSRNYNRLRAAVLVGEGKYDLALALLSADGTPEDNNAIADANFRSGNFEAAARGFRETGLSEQEFEAAFRSTEVPLGDWEGEEMVSTLRRLQLNEELDESVGELAVVKNLLIRNEQIRADTSVLLQETDFTERTE